MVFGFGTVERGVEAAVSLIKPLIVLAWATGKRTTPSALRDPYVLGLLVTLIDLEARSATGGRARTGLVVFRAWRRITGDDGVGVGSWFMTLPLAATQSLTAELLPV